MITIRIYISSTSVDLKEHRDSTIKTILHLDHQPIAMEFLPACPIAPVEKCLKDIASCKVFIGIIAGRYGFIPEGYDKSITELEYREAKRLEIPRLIFLSDYDNKIFEESGESREKREMLQAFREELGKEYIVNFFKNPDDLSKKVAIAIANYTIPSFDSSFVTSHIVGVRPGNVTSFFKDRVNELEEVQSYLKDQSIRLVNIVGRGGCGKTALLSKVCREIEHGTLRLPSLSKELGVDALIYINCKGMEKITAERIVQDIARTMKKSDSDEILACWKEPTISLQRKCGILFEKMRSGCFLLVLDNLEEILAEDNNIADEDLRYFIEICVSKPNAIKFFSTSRKPLLILSPICRKISLENGLPLNEAITLLREFDPDGDLGLKDSTHEVLSALAEKCFGLPRAFELVAAKLQKNETLTVSDLIQDEGLFNREVVENLVADQYKMIPSNQQHIMQSLAVYNEPVKIDAVRYLVNSFFPDIDVEKCLQDLVKIRAVTFRRGLKTYELHPIDQNYVYSKIPDNDSVYSKNCLHRKSAEFYINLSRSVWKGPLPIRKNPSTVASIKEVEEWMSCWRKALLHFKKVNAKKDINRFDMPLRDYFFAVLDFGTFLERYELCRLMLDTTSSFENRNGEAYWSHETAVINHHKGDYKVARRICERGIDVAREIDDFRNLGHLLHRLALINEDEGYINEALLLLEESRMNKERGEIFVHVIATKLAYAMILEKTGKIHESRNLFHECLSEYKNYQNKNNYETFLDIAWAMRSLGKINLKIGKFNISLNIFRRAINFGLKNEIVNSRISVIYKNFAIANMLAGNIEDAYIAANKARDLARFIHLRYECEAIHIIGYIHHCNRNYDKAIENYLDSLNLNPVTVAHSTHILLGIAYNAVGKYKESKFHLRKGLEMCGILLERTPELYEIRSTYALGLLAQGKITESMENYKETLSVCSLPGVVKGIMQELDILSHSFSNDGRCQEIIELCHPFLKNL